MVQGLTYEDVLQGLPAEAGRPSEYETILEQYLPSEPKLHARKLGSSKSGGGLGAKFERTSNYVAGTPTSPGLLESGVRGVETAAGTALGAIGKFGERALHNVIPNDLTRAEMKRREESAGQPGRDLMAYAESHHPAATDVGHKIMQGGGQLGMLVGASMLDPAAGALALGGMAAAGVEGRYDALKAQGADEATATQGGLAEAALQIPQLLPVTHIAMRLATAEPAAASLLRKAIDATIRGGADAIGPASATILGQALQDKLTKKERFDLGESLKAGGSEALGESAVNLPLFIFMHAMAGTPVQSARAEARPSQATPEGGPSGEVAPKPTSFAEKPVETPSIELGKPPEAPMNVQPEVLPAKPPLEPQAPPAPEMAPRPSEAPIVEPVKAPEVVAPAPPEPPSLSPAAEPAGAVEPSTTEGGFPWEAKAEKPKAYEATGGIRPLTRAEERNPISRQDVREGILGMARAAKTIGVGGEQVAVGEGYEGFQAKGRTSWANAAEWWDRRPAGNKLTPADIQNAAQKVWLNPKAKLGPAQQEIIDFLRDEVVRGIPTIEQAREAKASFEEAKRNRLLQPLPEEPGMRGALDLFGPRKAVAKKGDGSEGFDVPEETSADRLYIGVVNDLQRIVNLEKAAPKKARALSGESIEEALSLFPGRKFDQGAKMDEQLVRPLAETFKEIPPDKAGDFLMALHVPDALKELGEKAAGGKGVKESVGMTEAEASKIVSDALSGPNAEAYKKLQAWNQAANKAALDILESGSLISKETRVEWERRFGENFVHLKSVPDAMAQEFFGSGGFNVAGKESKARKGRESKAGNPIAFRLMSLREAISRKERNRVGNLLADLVRQNPHDVWRIESDRNKVHESEYALSFKENGEQRYIATKDKGLVDAFKRIQEPEPGAVALLDPINKWLHNVIIKWNPVFPLYNVPKDIGSASAKMAIGGDMKGALATATNALPAARGVFAELRKPGSGGEWGAKYRQLRGLGGIVGWNEQYSFEQQVNEFKKATTQPAKAFAFGRLMDKLNQAAEVGTRLAAFDAFQKSGMKDTTAAMEARRVTADFARRGRWAPVYRRLYLFSGANIQGSAEIARSIKANPGKASAVLGALLGAGFANAAMSDLFGDPKELEKLSEDEKARFFGVMVGGTRYGLPAPYGFNVFPYMGHKLYDITKGEAPSKALGQGFSAALDSFSPLPRGANFIQDVTPTFARPAVEIAQNQKFSGAPIAPEPSPYDRNPPPQHERYFRSVSGVSKEAARELSNVGIDISPEILDHIAGAVTGGLGQTLLRTQENIRKVVTGETDGMRPQDIPIAGEALRPFVRQAPESAGTSLFWNTVRRVETAEAKVKDGDAKLTDPTTKAEWQTAFALKGYEKPMKALRDAIKKATDDEARAKLEARLKDLQEKFLDVARKNGMRLEGN